MRVLGSLSLLVVLFLSACSGSGQSSVGVARIDESEMVELSTKSAGASTSDAGTLVRSSKTDELTDEEIVTFFAACMRDHGIDTPDPELNADGTIDWEPLKDGIAQDPNYESRSEKAFEDCLPLLAGITASEKESAEDDIELQDDLLRFAQCLRDEGIDVPDPGFSGDPRKGMGSVKEVLKGADSRVERSFYMCNELVFGSGESGK
jgi:hypothetical protein